MSNYGLDLLAIHERLHKLQNNEENKKSAKKTRSLERRLQLFLSQLPHSPDFTVMTPQDVCRFLVWSDQFGKTQVHALKTDQLNQPIVIVISPLNIIQKDQLSTLSDHSVPSCRLNIETRLSEFTDDGRLYQANSYQNLEDFVWFFVTQRPSLTPSLDGHC